MVYWAPRLHLTHVGHLNISRDFTEMHEVLVTWLLSLHRYVTPIHFAVKPLHHARLSDEALTDWVLCEVLPVSNPHDNIGVPLTYHYTNNQKPIYIYISWKCIR